MARYVGRSIKERLSMLLGEAIQSVSGGLSSSEDDDNFEERSRSNYIDGSP
ncbi:uncharacterized protein PHALS_01888 [Plasmopara halstedii]|uniref:Uncharacterized protein n=1 Tax=Plasmopara halstedii TaxID=4781 RepID=A0A0P1AUI2_PLAHL|nr:uncharacterized protein PHALS_01888 [Plasmopara halstedii]CEG45602.1 hypothetical protein PHALS_01888 [Plasmopara halstedii]|eukprot:XP_024581971.1 hypothetical protein PHALS_01888 [Plasmopara halstedii]